MNKESKIKFIELMLSKKGTNNPESESRIVINLEDNTVIKKSELFPNITYLFNPN